MASTGEEPLWPRLPEEGTFACGWTMERTSHGEAGGQVRGNNTHGGSEVGAWLAHLGNSKATVVQMERVRGKEKGDEMEK